MFATAVGVAGISPSDFDLLTFDELDAIIGRVRTNEDQSEQMHWERSRQMAYLIAGPYLKRGTTLKQFWPMPWDKADKELKPASSMHRILQQIST